MLRTLFLLFAIAILPVALSAQTDTKTKQITIHPNMDYKQMDAPLPPIMFMAYQSTPAANAGKKHGRRKKKIAADTGNVISFHAVTNKDLDNNANLFVMLFNPTCGHCEDVTAMLRDNIDVFKKSKIVLVANNMMRPYLPDFVDRMHISSTAHMYIGYDTSQIIDNLFLYQSLPQINIYSAERKLLKTYCGEVPIDTLKKFIQ